MLESIRIWLERTGWARSGLILGAGGLAIVAILMVARFAATPERVPLFPGMPLEEAAKVSAALDEAGISYNLAKGGAEVQVAEADFARARVSLAQAGLPAKGSKGFELFDQPAWGMTDFTQRINYRRALEGELERTISEMRDVEAARVHIALRESASFRSTSTPEAASVVLTVRGGGRPGGELVEAVASLVASAVDGLDSDRVTVLDAVGHLLSAAVEPGSTDGYTKRQMRLQREVEGYLEQRSEDLLAQTVGPGNARVRVSADLTFDKVDRTTQRLNPDEQVATHEERSEILPSAGQVGAASTASTTTYDVSRTVETFSGAAGTVRRLSVAVLLNERTAGDGTAQPWAWTGTGGTASPWSPRRSPRRKP
jgi:flagellar M-ring protein FliF